MKVGERVLLPAVRRASKDTLIIADGFSCREQIAQSTDRRALHLAQVIQMALPQHENRAVGDYPESLCISSNSVRSEQSLSKSLPSVFCVSVMLVGGVSTWLWKNFKKRT